jgi:hypothetical protein
MDSGPLPFAPIVVCASSERGGYRYLGLTVTWSASLAHSQVTAPSELSRSRLPALLARPSLGSSSLAIGSASAEGAAAVAAMIRRLYPDCAVEPDRPREYGGTAMRLRLGRARPLGGWSGPGNQVKGGDTS